jgi:hypothetical protein
MSTSSPTLTLPASMRPVTTVPLPYSQGRGRYSEWHGPGMRLAYGRIIAACLDGEDALDGHGKGAVDKALRRGDVVVHRAHERSDGGRAKRLCAVTCQSRQR